MKASEFDKRFDEGEDITAALDLDGAKRPYREQEWVRVNLPSWIIESLDREAARLRVTRESIVRIWLAERLKNPAHEPD
jgi:hypothetical protein